MLKSLSKIYGFFVRKRNREFDSGKRPGVAFELPILSVGNLNTGGTGKTPHIEYLVALLRPHYSVAILSRGYGRKTKGFRLGSDVDSADSLGDEPFQYYQKYVANSANQGATSQRVSVAVSESRVIGVSELIAQCNPDVILLDDAFQHRKIKPGFQIVLTTFQEPYTRDSLIPAGRLRESIDGADRADVIMVTKCPSESTDDEKMKLGAELQLKDHQQLFFSSFEYGAIRPEGEVIIESPKRAYVLCGIAKPDPFLREIKKHFELKGIQVHRDHHRFTKKDIQRLRRDATPFLNRETIILTTEKDFVRLLPLKDLWRDLPIYTWPIKPVISAHERFDSMILDYVRKSK